MEKGELLQIPDYETNSTRDTEDFYDPRVLPISYPSMHSGMTSGEKFDHCLSTCLNSFGIEALGTIESDTA